MTQRLALQINPPLVDQKKVKLPRVRTYARTTKGVAGLIVILIVVIGITWIIVSRQNTVKNINQAATPGEVVENLEYQTILPEGKSVTDIGGWRRISPPGSDAVYAYTDKIGEVAITVSQQPLPQSFKDNLAVQIAELAKKFNATTKIDANGTPVYVGTSTKGPQSAILTKNGLLILIKSQQKITDTAWSKYANTLN